MTAVRSVAACRSVGMAARCRPRGYARSAELSTIKQSHEIWRPPRGRHLDSTRTASHRRYAIIPPTPPADLDLLQEGPDLRADVAADDPARFIGRDDVRDPPLSGDARSRRRPPREPGH